MLSKPTHADAMGTASTPSYKRWSPLPSVGRCLWGWTQQASPTIVPTEMVPAILRQLHDAPSEGHLGFTKTLDKIWACFYCPGQRRDVEDWCRACQTCALRKSPSRNGRAPLQSETAGIPLQHVAMDVLAPLPQTLSGNKYIVVIGEYFTKWMEAFPMPTMEAITIAELFVNNFVCRFMNNFVCRFGTPDQLHTDQGRNFEANATAPVSRSQHVPLLNS